MLRLHVLSTILIVIFIHCHLAFADPLGTVVITPGGTNPEGTTIQETVPLRPSGRDTFAALPVDALWAKISASNGNAIIGIKKPGSPRGAWKSTTLISQAEVEVYTNQITAIVGVSSIVYRDPVLPYRVFKLDNQAALETIHHLPFVDYIEPGNLELQRLGIGCGKTNPTWSSTFDASGDIIPRIFSANGIDRAWKRQINGKGINIGVVDTGLFRGQEEFWPERFASITENVRTIRYGDCLTQQCLDSLPDGAFDQCNHGTRIAGAIAAPRDGANIVGVAYGANLHAVKVADGVWSDDPLTDISHIRGIRAVREAGARIIEMAFGGTFTSNVMSDVIMFEYYRTDRPEVLFVAAAGTLVCVPLVSVTFPARLPEVLAVTGVNRDGTLAAEVCNGPEVDLAAVLEDFETTGDTLGSVITLGGSSGASAMVAGIAALVWSQNPAMTRSQVIDRLRDTAWQSPSLGVRVVNAYVATGGIRTARIIGPSYPVTAEQSYTLGTEVIGDGPFAYTWDRGETTSSVNRSGPGQSSVTVKDLTDGNEIRLNFTVVPVSPTETPGTETPDIKEKKCLKKPWLCE